MSLTTTTDRADVISVLRSSLYPGAKTESIELVLSYCRINGLDPMLKPVHIVPTSVKNSNGQWETRDVLMPGIADYRIKAARSGEYLGKSEPIFGPVVTDTIGNTKVTYPEWCKITIRRSVGGKEAEFTATEYWLENYASKKRDDPSPNAMWHKRAFGQLAKCTEAQVLRMAFPEFSGGAVTAEEMEGKVLEGVVEAAPAPPPKPRMTPEQWAEQTIARFQTAATFDEVSALASDVGIGAAMAKLETTAPDLYAKVDEARMAAMDRVAPYSAPPADGEMLA
jgi:phage recombination protein Bet